MFQADRNITRASKKCSKPTSICIRHTWVIGVESEDKRLAKKSDADSLIQPKNPPAFHMMSIQAIMCQTALWSCRASLRCGEVIQSHANIITHQDVFYLISFLKEELRD